MSFPAGHDGQDWNTLLPEGISIHGANPYPPTTTSVMLSELFCSNGDTWNHMKTYKTKCKPIRSLVFKNCLDYFFWGTQPIGPQFFQVDFFSEFFQVDFFNQLDLIPTQPFWRKKTSWQFSKTWHVFNQLAANLTNGTTNNMWLLKQTIFSPINLRY